MKPFRTLLTVLSLTTIIFYSGCGGGGGGSQSIQQKQLGLLSKKWVVSTVSLGPTSAPVDKTSDWATFNLTIAGTTTAGSYSWDNRKTPGPWAASGTWAFDATNPQTLIIRDPGTSSNAENLPVGYTINAAGTTLQLTFDYEGDGLRMSSVSGQWTFNFVPATN